MEFPKIVQDLVNEKAKINNRIDLDAYTKGLLDMYNALKPQSDESEEVNRQIQIIYIKSYITNTNGSTELKDYNLKMNFRNVPVYAVGAWYIVNKNDDEFDFEEMNDEEIDELYGIIKEMEIIDDKTMRRTEN